MHSESTFKVSYALSSSLCLPLCFLLQLRLSHCFIALPRRNICALGGDSSHTSAGTTVPPVVAHWLSGDGGHRVATGDARGLILTPWPPLTFCSRAGTMFPKVVSLYGLMSGSLSSTGRDMGRKGHQWCWKRTMTCQHCGDTHGPPQSDPLTAHPIQSGHLVWQKYQLKSSWGCALGPPSPWDHPPTGHTVGSLLHPVARGLSPGLLAGLCGMGGRPPPCQLALLENRREITVWL